jgi:glycosyltransferase involved in cell wall biosynthesis/O-antigen ligase/aminoglycoside phosphotransferase (APT) family kinase protein
MQTRQIPVRLEWLALLPLLLLMVAFVQYAVSDPRLLHIDVAFTPAALTGAAAAAALCVLILRSRDFALVLLVAAVYLNLSNVLVRQGFPSLLQFAAVPLLLAALTSRQPADWLRLARQPLTWLLAGYALVLLGSTVYAQSPTLADERFSDTAKALLIYALIVLLASSARRVRLAAWTMLLASSVLAALGILRILDINVPGLSDGLARLELAHIHGNVFEPRITGPLGDANFFAQILLVLVPIGLFLAWESRTRWPRLAAYGSVALIVGATVLTYSRGGAVALAFVLVVALLASGISWKRLASGAAVLALLWTMAIPADFAARLATVRQFLPGGEEVLHRDSSFEERLLLTGTAWQMFIDNPALGVGGGNYAARFNEYSQRLGSTSPDYHDESAPRYPHNLFLEVAAETGLLGLAFFAAALLAAFTALNRARRSPSLGGLSGLARAVQIGIAGYLISSLFLHGDFQRYLWLLIGMAGAMEALVVTRRRVPRSNLRTARESLAATSGSDPDPVEQATHPPARRGIAVLLSRFPSVTETFILREVIEMERQGQPVCLMPLLREHPPIVHGEARPWVERALYTPFLSLPIVAANVRALVRHPARYLTLVARLLLGTLRSPRVFAGTISIIPKSFYLAERARAQGIRHVHAHFATHPTTAALIISVFADASFSFTIHAHDLFSRKYRPLLRMKLDRAAFVRVISRYNREHLRAHYPGAPLEKVHVIHVGIEPELYGRADTAEPGDTAGDATPEGATAPVRLMSVAALRDYKGIPVLLAACRRLLDDGMNVRCDVVGEGPMRPQLEREIHRLGLEQCVRLLGAKPQHEVRALLAERPIFVLSSVVMPDGWMEGIPVALMEAMASGAAVVTSRISGIPELVENGVSGVLVEQGDPDALARAIRQLASAPDVALRLGIAGRSQVNAGFRLDMTVQQLLALIDSHNAQVAPVVTNAAARGLNGTSVGARVGVRAVHEGTDATVAELVVGEEGGSVHQWVLKIHRDHAAASSAATRRAENEGEALEALSDGVGVATARGSEPRRSLGVPRLIRRSSSEGWLVMESCAGMSVAELLRVSRGSLGGEHWQATLTVLRQTGDWLRGLHQRELNVDAGAAIAEWHAALATDLDRCRSVVPLSVLLDVQDQLAAALTNGADSPSFAVLHHGDFGPGNVLVSEDRIQVIDFEGWRPGLPYEDVAYFAMQLELFFQYPLLRGRGQQAVAAFLEGYLNGKPLDSHAYLTARKSKALQILARTSSVRPVDMAGRRRRSALRRILTDRSL